MNDLQEWGEMKLESPRGWVWADFSGVGDPDSDEEDEEGEEQEESQGTTAGPPPPNGAPTNDASSDSENNAPRSQLTQAPSDDAMQIDPQAHLQTPTITHAVAHTPQDLRHGVTPTLTRPTPRLPFAALSPNTAPRPTSSPRRPKMPVLRAHLVQIKILENHQNGKDTHLRGLQIFARNDEDLSRSAPAATARGGAMKTLIGEGVGLDKSLVNGKGETRGPRRIERLELGAASRSAWDVEPNIR